jgi:CubicO group peptidase (beta-lactamase class C family)
VNILKEEAMNNLTSHKYRWLRYLLFFICLTFILTVVKCKQVKEPTQPPYTPHDLTDSTWELISNPESVGWSTQKLQVAYDYSRTIQTAAVMIIFQDQVLYYWGDIKRKFNMHSCRKSLLSVLIGIHVDEGNIDLTKTMVDLNIDDNPPQLTDLEKTATVQMLLQARSGIYHEAAYESAGMKAARPERYSHAPGTFWYYNNWDFNVLGVIFEQETGKGIFEEFKERIADPIGMEDFLVSDGTYVYEPVSIHPAYPFRMTARDAARFGLLCLRYGEWEGNRIVSEEWLRESTTSYSDAGSYGGYGYMWWVAVGGRHLPHVALNDGCYSARGYGGHYIVVIPDMDLVVVHRVNTDVGHSVSSDQFGRLVKLILDAKIN